MNAFVKPGSGSLDTLGASPSLSMHTIEMMARGETADAIVIPDAQLLFTGNFSRAGSDLILSKDGRDYVVNNYFKDSSHKDLVSADGSRLTSKLVDTLTGYTQFAQTGPADPPKVIGHVTKMTGSATVIRNGVSVALNSGDNVMKGDVVQAGADSSLGLTFMDGTVFALSSNARMVLNEMIYDPNGSQNSSLLSLVAGTISFVAGETAKHGDMKVDTPVATMGIRGTAVLVEIGFELMGPTATAPPVRFQVVLEPGPNGPVSGSFILLHKTTGQPIGTVNAVGTVTFVSGNGLVNSQPAPPLSPEAKFVIQSALTDFFPNYVPDNKDTDPKTQSDQHGSSTPPPPPTTDRPQIIERAYIPDKVQLPDGTFVPIIKVVDIPHVNTKPLITVKEVVDETTFKIGDKVTIFDPDIGDGLFNDIPTPFVPHTGNVGDGEAVLSSEVAVAAASLGGLIHVDQTGKVTYDEATLKGLIHIDQETGEVTYDMNDFAFLAKGEKAVFFINFKSSSGPDTLDETLKLTINGVNDQPVISGNHNANAEEQDAPTGSTNPVVANGELVLTDPDLADTHQITTSTFVSAEWSGHDGSEIPQDTLDALNAAFETQLLDDAHDGTAKVDWAFSVPDDTLDFLAEGETLTVTYKVVVTDSEGEPNSNSEPFYVTVTIGSTNDQPVVSADVSGPHTYTEAANTGSDAYIAALLGKLAFQDADLSDTHSAAAVPTFVWSHGDLTDAQVDALVAASQLTLSVEPDTTGGAAGEVDFSYTAAEKTFDFLAAGETLTISYAVTVTDNSGHFNDSSSPPQIVTFTVTGSNDGPVITSAPTSGGVKEDTAVDGAGNVAADGTITFQDVDLTDTHTATAAFTSSSSTLPGFIANTTHIGTFALTPATVGAGDTVVENADTINTANVGWTFTLADDDPTLQSLAEGQTIKQTYKITVTDNHGAKSTQDVTVTITGKNDTPDIIVTNPAAVDEGDAGTPQQVTVTVANQVAISDVDLSDVHTPYVAGTLAFDTATGPAPAGGTLASLFTLNPVNGTISYDKAAFDYLDTGESVTATFTFNASSGPDTVPQTITVTINGENDAPVITSASFAVIKGSTAVLSASNITVVDPDDSAFTFTVAAITHGTIEVFNGTAWEAATTFSDGDLAAGHVRFVNDGSAEPPTLSLTASDGEASSQPVDVAIDFNPTAFTLTSMAGVSIQISPYGATNGFVFPGAGNVTTPGTPEDHIGLGYDVGGTHVVVNSAPLLGEHEFGSVSSSLVQGSDSSSVVDVLDAGNGVTLTQTTTLGHDANYFTTTIDIYNGGTEDINNVRFQRSFDPDQDYAAYGTFETLKDVVQNPTAAEPVAIVSAVGPYSGVNVSLVGLDDTWRGSAYALTNRDPYAAGAFDSPVDPNGALLNRSISLTDSIGTIAPGEHAEVIYITTANVATSGDNALFGTDGNDTINGLGGNDLLIGLAGNDTFVFGPASGKDTVYDFHPGEDLIDISAVAGVDAGNLGTWLNTHATQVGNDTVIALDVDPHAGTNTVVLQNVALANLQNSNFIVHA